MKFNEFLTNTNGKLSGSGLIGVFTGIASILVFISGAVASYLGYPESLDLMDKALMGLTIAAALLGVRKITKNEQEFKRE